MKVSVFLLLMLALSPALGQETSKYKQAEEKREESKAPAADAGSVSTGASAGLSQESFWRQQVQTNQSPTAYLNYYTTVRSKHINKNSRQVTGRDKVTLDSLVNKASSRISGTFEYHYIKFLNEGYDNAYWEHLKKAESLAQNKVELLDELLFASEITGSTENRKQYSVKVSSAGIYSSFKYEYAKNTLLSVSENSVLFTTGATDTQPIWVQQDVHNFRADVTVINLDHAMNSNAYRMTLKQKGFKIPSANSEVNFVEEFARLNPNRAVYVSLTSKPNTLRSLRSKLFLSGLAFRYSTSPIDNQELLAAHFDSFTIDELKSNDKSSDDKRLSNNYIVLLSNLYKYYLDVNERRVNRVRSLAKMIADENGIWNQVKGHF